MFFPAPAQGEDGGCRCGRVSRGQGQEGQEEEGAARKALIEFGILYPFSSLLLFYATEPTFFITIFIKNRVTKVSDQGLAALGSFLNYMKSLTNLSLDFSYFFHDYFSEF